MPYEPTQKKNPKQLTVNQHVHTSHAITKFNDIDKKVEVKILSTDEIAKLHSKDKIFCTKRTWDQRAERGYMVPIEKSFHEEIDSIKTFDKRNHEAISRYWLLWRLRQNFRLSNNDDITLNGLSGSDLTQDQEETLETNWCSFVRKGGVLPSRFISGLQIQFLLDRDWDIYKHWKWGLIEAIEGEFIVSDGYENFSYMPISPTLAFCVGNNDQRINKQQLAETNFHSVSRAKKYYFARKLSECPIAKKDVVVGP